MFKLWHASDASNNIVHLVDQPPEEPAHSAARELKKMRTRGAIRAAIKELGVPSAYALEAKVAELRGLHFDYLTRSKLFEKLARQGWPAIEDASRWPMEGPEPGQSQADFMNKPGRGLQNSKILEAMWLLEHVESVGQTLRYPLWQLLGPEMPPTKWLNQLRRALKYAALDEGSSYLEHPRIVFVVIKGELETRSGDSALYFLTRAVLQLRLAEQAGDLAQFVACLRALLAVDMPKGHPILDGIGSSFSGYLAKVFNPVRFVGRSTHAIAIAKGRLLTGGIALTPADASMPLLDQGDQPSSRTAGREFKASPAWPEVEVPA